MARKIVIVGASSAGVSAAEAARIQDPLAEIDLFSREKHLPYYRLRLCEVIDQPGIVDELTIHPADWYEAQRIKLHLGKEVVAIERNQHQIRLQDNQVIPYDSLILASGSSSFVPPLEGIEHAGVMTLWTLDDAQALARRLETARRAVVIGGGLLGLLAAYHLRKAGVAVTILERGERLLSNQLDQAASAIFLQAVKGSGVEVAFQASTARLLGYSDLPGSPVSGVLLQDGRTIPADLVLISTGVRSNNELAQQAGLKCGKRIVTDTAMRTSDPVIFAAGDTAEPLDYWFGLWPVAMDQGWVAGINAAGGDTVYARDIPPYFVQAMGTQVVALGDKGLETATDDEPLAIDLENDIHGGNYSKQVYRGDVLRGFMLVGDTSDYARLQRKVGQKLGLIQR